MLEDIDDLIVKQGSVEKSRIPVPERLWEPVGQYHLYLRKRLSGVQSVVVLDLADPEWHISCAGSVNENLSLPQVGIKSQRKPHAALRKTSFDKVSEQAKAKEFVLIGVGRIHRKDQFTPEQAGKIERVLQEYAQGPGKSLGLQVDRHPELVPWME